MSIFSRILKRGPEEGDPKPAPSAGKSAGAAEPAKPDVPAAGASPVEPAAAPARIDPPRAETKAAPAPAASPAGPAKGHPAAARPAPAPTPAPPVPPPRRTPARTAPAVSPSATRPAPVAQTRTAASQTLLGMAPPPRIPAAPPKAPARDEAPPADAASSAASLDQVFEQMFRAEGARGDVRGARPAASEGKSTSGDRRTLLATFEDLAVGHTAQVRGLMLEVRWGEAQTSWIELARPALKSMRAMAAQIDHAPLVAALDGFEGALAVLLLPGAPPAIGPAARDALLAAYAPLVAAMPRAFELDGERDRREPVLVRALLEQVPGLDALMIDRMAAAGLGRLDELFRAKADEIAVVASIPGDVAAGVVARLQAFRRATPSALTTPDPAATARELRALCRRMESDHQAFEDAARGWSAGDRDAKKRLRRRREVTFLEIVVALARLGDIDLVLALQKAPFARRIEELDRVLGQLTAAGPPGAVGSAPAALPAGIMADAPSYERLEIERPMDSGAHAAP